MFDNINPSELFAAFAKAGDALRLVPELETKIANLETERDHLREQISDHGTTIDGHVNTIAELRATLAKREEELAQATFREEAHSRRMAELSTLVGLASDIMKDSTPTPDVTVTVETAQVNPAPEPVQPELPIEKVDKPNIGREHWLKPNSMSDADWIASGGMTYDDTYGTYAHDDLYARDRW